MTQENVELAWRAARAWNEGGVEAFLSYLDPEVIWHAPQESMEPGDYRGGEEIEVWTFTDRGQALEAAGLSE